MSSSGGIPPAESNPSSSTATPTNVNLNGAAQQFLASNSNRKGCAIWNDQASNGATIYLGYWANVSETNYMVQIPAGGYWEMPDPPTFTGVIYGFGSSAAGTARITELS